MINYYIIDEDNGMMFTGEFKNEKPIFKFPKYYEKIKNYSFLLATNFHEKLYNLGYHSNIIIAFNNDEDFLDYMNAEWGSKWIFENKQ